MSDVKRPSQSRLVTTIFPIAILFVGLGFIGCETTDYEPVELKAKLQELEDRIEKSNSNGPSESLLERIRQLESEVKALKKNEVEVNSGNLIAEPTAASMAEFLVGIEKADGYVQRDEAGQIVRVDLSDAVYDNELLAKLIGCRSIKRISLDGTKADLATFEILGKLPNIEHIDIEKSAATEESLSQLTGLEKLKYLQLFRSDVTDEGFRFLAQIPNLEQIRCGQTRISDEALVHLVGCKSLRALDLSDCNRVSDEGLKSLANLPNLAFLKVWGPKITDEGMKTIGQIKSLRVLGLNDTQVTDAGMEFLSDLELTEIHLFRTNVGDEGVRVLAKMSNLSSLNLRDTKISDIGVGYLTNLTKIRKLDLSETNSPGITGASGFHFSQLENLEELNLWSTAFSDIGVSRIVNLPKLRWLNLDKTKITDVAVEFLPSIRRLSWLHIGSNKITDLSSDTLVNLKNLTYLNFSQTEIGGDKEYEIYEALPDCEVVGQ